MADDGTAATAGTAGTAGSSETGGTAPDRVTRDVLATFEDVRSRLFRRLEGLTDAEYLWEPDLYLRRRA